MNRPDTDAQDQLLQIITFGLQRAAGPYRDFSAWIGLVPKQMSTGDRTILGRISKRGNGYLRTLFIRRATKRRRP